MTTPSLGKVKVGGALAGSDVRVSDAIGTITVGSVTGSRIYAGVSSLLSDLPDSLDSYAIHNPSGEYFPLD